MKTSNLDSPDIKPLGQAMSDIVRYPFQASVLPMLLISSVAMLLALLPGLLGSFLALLVWATLFKLSYEILVSTARGELDGPPPVTTMSGGIIFKHFGLLVTVIVFLLFAAWLLKVAWLVMALSLIVLTALPAAIMVLAMTQSLLQAINPVNWWELVRQTGASYALTVVMLLAMILTETRAESFILPLLADSMILMTLVSTFVSAYFMAASFHLMGYLLYQHHEALGIELSPPVSLDKRGPAKRRSSEDESLEVLRQRSQQMGLASFCEQLCKEIERDGAEPAVHEFYREQLRQLKDDKALLKHGERYITALIHGFEDMQRALAVVDECQGIDKGFLPEYPSDVQPMALAAAQQGRHDLVLRLSSAFGRRHLDHPDLVDNYLLAAKSMLEHRNQRDKALALVQKMKRRFPDHPRANDLAAFERRLV
jgi:hypothetical protein